MIDLGIQNHSKGHSFDPSQVDAVRWYHLFGSLIGHRGSLMRMVNAKSGLMFTAALVFLAGLAREYDAVSLFHHPLDLFAPFAASILLATVLFVLISLGIRIASGQRQNMLWRRYRGFLIGYWITAPLAWLYAIPLEVMADELSAAKGNLALLTIVSLWRVFLFPRIVSVYFHIPYLIALAWISIPCIAVALMGLMISQFHLVGIMGGIRLTETERIVLDFQHAAESCLVSAFVVACVLWLGSIIWIAYRSQTPGSIEPPLLNPNPVEVLISRGLWLALLIVLGIFLLGLSHFQPPLYRAGKVDRWLRNQSTAAAIEWMTNGGEDQFPSRWDPPPQVRENGEPTVLLSTIVDELEQAGSGGWVSQKLLERFAEIHLRQSGRYWGVDFDNLAVDGLGGEHHGLSPQEEIAFLERVLRLNYLDTPEQKRVQQLIHGISVWQSKYGQQ